MITKQPTQLPRRRSHPQKKVCKCRDITLMHISLILVLSWFIKMTGNRHTRD
ncbi:hypothetical protein L209DRAFT_394657 [Thermothelomyces heterothallicus CBS 203.75]